MPVPRTSALPAWRPPEWSAKRRRNERPPFATRRSVYWMFRLIEMAVQAMPYPAATGFARAVGWFVHAVDRKHRRTAHKNLRLSFPGWTATRLRETVRRTYEHCALIVVELFFVRRLIRRETLDRYATFVGWENTQRALARGKGLIIVVGHLGNWEFAGVASVLRGLRATSVARPLDNRWVNDHLVRARAWTGQEVVYKKDALRRLVPRLREGRVVVIPSDQNVRSGGVFVPFFGRTASTVKAAALLCEKYGTPLVVASKHRTGRSRFHHVIEFSEPVVASDFPDDGRRQEHITAHFTRKLEESIRRHPAQYLWMHKRWKTRPAGETLSTT